MIALNAVFAAYEIALASISIPRLSVLLDEKRKGAKEALFMKERMEGSLAVIQLGITLVGAIAAAVGGAGVEESLTPYLSSRFGMSDRLAESLSLTLFIIPLTFATMILGELVPKVFALGNKEWICLRFSPVMKLFSRVLRPFVFVIEITVKRLVKLGAFLKSEEDTQEKRMLNELRTLVALARGAKILGPREERIINVASVLLSKPVRDIIIPAQDISMIPATATLTEALIEAHKDMHTRFPVCRVAGDPQTIDGYVNFKDIIAALRMNPSNPTIEGIVRPIKRVPERMPLSQLLETMIREKAHIVIATTSARAISGMATTDDILEEFVGKIEAEYDRLPGHIYSYGQNWIIGGGASMLDVGRESGLSWSSGADGRVPTFAEWCAAHGISRLVAGESVRIDEYEIIPRKFRRKKVAEAAVRRVT